MVVLTKKELFSLLAADSALTSAGLQLVSYTNLEVECPLKDTLMKRGGFCKNVFTATIFVSFLRERRVLKLQVK